MNRKLTVKSLLVSLMLALAPFVRAQEPVRSSWLVNPATANASLARVRPEVHSVSVNDRFVEINSAGISLHYLGALQSATGEIERLRQLRFRIPLAPVPESGQHISLRSDVVGVFLNGLPISNQFETSSYRGQNLWHFDALAANDDGSLIAAGHRRAEQHQSIAAGLFEGFVADASRHSPIIGYAFDGYPIYGPWAFAANGGLQRMRSSYRLRQIKRRTHLPDGTALTPAQIGPDVSAEFPPGTFVEDYEFAAGFGDLDQFNGRFAKTPEYPAGTYAYFMTTDVAGRLSFPYLLAHQYRGRISAEDLAQSFRDLADGNPPPSATPLCHEIVAPVRPGDSQLTLKTEGATIQAGQPARLSFQIRSPRGLPVRFPEHVHERPLHLLIVSEDLAEFAHIHPELTTGDRYEVTHTFPNGGRYRLYADFTPPGAAQRIETFDLKIEGKPRATVPLVADSVLDRKADSLQVEMAAGQLRAGEDFELRFVVRDAATGKTVDDLEPYLGAWAHFVLIDRQQKSFLHAHPIESGSLPPVVTSSAALSSDGHLHAALAGPSPSEIRTMVSFPAAGLYKLWAQFQREGKVIIVPFVLKVAEARPSAKAFAAIPGDAIKINVGQSGFAPARLEVKKGQPIKLAFVRPEAGNCGGMVIFPALGIRQSLPVGEAVIVEVTPKESGELSFSCAMGMYKGALVVH